MILLDKQQECAYLTVLISLGSMNWRFERVMIAEINSGAVNALLLRPSSFFEYHMGQLLGQKLITALAMVPVISLQHISPVGSRLTFL